MELDYDVDEGNDLFGLAVSFYDKMNFKIAFIIFAAYVVFSTDIFAERVLNKIDPSAYDSMNDRILPKGIVMSAMITAIVYLLVDVMVQSEAI